MGSKAFLLLGLLFAIVLVISSDVAARELAEDSTNEKVDATDIDAKHHENLGADGRSGYNGLRGDGGCRYGCCRRGHHGQCFRCCHHANEAVDAQTEAKPKN